jgi:S-phase kinase-associated protein 1
MQVVLKSSDEVLFNVNVDVAKQSILLRGLFEEFQDNSYTTEIIPVENIRSVILQKIIEYMEYIHINPPSIINKPLNNPDLRNILSDWEYKFVYVEDSILFELIVASTYLNIPSLTDLVSAKIASYMVNKTTEEIRIRFGIESDLSEEEEQKIRDELKWAI